MATDIAGRSERRARRSQVAGIGTRSRRVLGVVGAVIVAAAVACSSDSGVRPYPIDLAAATDDAEAPWTAVLLSPQTPTTVPFGPPGSELPGEGNSDGVRVAGDRAGLYGGSPDRLLCDRQRLVDDLEQDPARMAAWANVFHVEDVRNYVRTLTPVLLRADTRVTDHGFGDGRASAFQSVLEAGTIVLIDERGVPRVRCVRGSPLLPPVLEGGPQLIGDPWPGFQEDRLLVVQPADLAMTEVSVVDLRTGGLLPVEIGAGPGRPADQPVTPPPPIPAPASPAPVPAPPVVSPAPVADTPPVPVQQAAPQPITPAQTEWPQSGTPQTWSPQTESPQTGSQTWSPQTGSPQTGSPQTWESSPGTASPPVPSLPQQQEPPAAVVPLPQPVLPTTPPPVPGIQVQIPGLPPLVIPVPR